MSVPVSGLAILSNAKLKEELRKRGLKVSGNKKQLIQRLHAHIDAGESAGPENDPSTTLGLELDRLGDKISPVLEKINRFDINQYVGRSDGKHVLEQIEKLLSVAVFRALDEIEAEFEALEAAHLTMYKSMVKALRDSRSRLSDGILQKRSEIRSWLTQFVSAWRDIHQLGGLDEALDQAESEEDVRRIELAMELSQGEDISQWIAERDSMYVTYVRRLNIDAVDVEKIGRDYLKVSVDMGKVRDLVADRGIEEAQTIIGPGMRLLETFTPSKKRK